MSLDKRRLVVKLVVYGGLLVSLETLAVSAYRTWQETDSYFILASVVLLQIAAIGMVVSFGYAALDTYRTLLPIDGATPGGPSYRTMALAVNTRIMFAWIAALWLLGSVFRPHYQPATWRVVVGLGIGILGLLWRSWALIYRDQHSGVLTCGPYRIIRHPRYVGTMLAFLGLSLPISPYSRALWPLGLLTIFHLLSGYKEEGDFLRSEHKLEYAAYRKRVPAVIPLGWPKKTNDDRLHLRAALTRRRTVERLAMTWLPAAAFIMFMFSQSRTP